MLNAIPGTLPKLERSWCLLLEEVFSILFTGIFVSGYNSETGVAGCGSGSLDVTLKLVYDHHFPPVRYKVRRWRKLNCKTIQYSGTSSDMCLEYLLGC